MAKSNKLSKKQAKKLRRKTKRMKARERARAVTRLQRRQHGHTNMRSVKRAQRRPDPFFTGRAPRLDTGPQRQHRRADAFYTQQQMPVTNYQNSSAFYKQERAQRTYDRMRSERIAHNEGQTLATAIPIGIDDPLGGLEAGNETPMKRIIKQEVPAAAQLTPAPHRTAPAAAQLLARGEVISMLPSR